MRSHTNNVVKGSLRAVPAAEAEKERHSPAGMNYGGRPYDPKDEWLLKYEVNDKGVGRILLPPSLSTLLQSDRVSITPSAGGLFIRSV
jgi:hypothetical protein